MKLTPPRIRTVDNATGLRRMTRLGYINDRMDSIPSFFGQFIFCIAAWMIQNKLRMRYGAALGRGCYRTVFQNGYTVYKVPHHFGAIGDNLKEATASLRPEWKGIPIASCDIVWHWTGIPIVVMEAVKPACERSRPTLPAWAGRVDSTQVGRNAACEWVTYDAGIIPMSGGGTHRHIREAAIPECFAA